MSIKRTVCCDVCKATYTEKHASEGFPDWGQVMGINLNGVDNPYLCPNHLATVANFVDSLVEEEDE